MYSVKAMEWKDLDEVYRIEVQAYPLPWRRQSFMDCLLSGLDCRVLVDSESQLQALCGYIISSNRLNIAHILNIAIKPACQNQGLGKFLLSTWLSSFEESLIDAAILEVRISNGNAIKLYKSLGFYEDGRKRNYYQDPGSTEDALVFKINLK